VHSIRSSTVALDARRASLHDDEQFVTIRSLRCAVINNGSAQRYQACEIVTQCLPERYKAFGNICVRERVQCVGWRVTRL